MGARRPLGKKPATNDAAVHTGLRVSPVTSAPTATVCIQVPMFDTRLPVHKSA